MPLIFTLAMLLYSQGDCVKYTLPRAEGIPMLITDTGQGYYDVFYTYPGIGPIHFRARSKIFERDTIEVDKKLCSVYIKDGMKPNENR